MDASVLAAVIAAVATVGVAFLGWVQPGRDLRQRELLSREVDLLSKVRSQTPGEFLALEAELVLSIKVRGEALKPSRAVTDTLFRISVIGSVPALVLSLTTVLLLPRVEGQTHEILRVAATVFGVAQGVCLLGVWIGAAGSRLYLGRATSMLRASQGPSKPS